MLLLDPCTFDRGMICIGRKRFQKALELLYNVRHSIFSCFLAIKDFCFGFNSIRVLLSGCDCSYASSQCHSPRGVQKVHIGVSYSQWAGKAVFFIFCSSSCLTWERSYLHESDFIGCFE